MKDNGKTVFVGAAELSIGQMVRYTKATGLMIPQMDTAGLYMVMVLCMRGNGLMIRLLGKGRIRIAMDRSTLESGRITDKTDME